MPARVRIDMPAALEGALAAIEAYPMPPTVRRLDTYLNLRTGQVATPLQSRTTGRVAMAEAATGDDCVANIEDALFLIGEMPSSAAEPDVDDDAAA